MTYAATSNESAVYEETYIKPDIFNQFMKDLQEGCAKGDAESKELIEKHAPEMASALQKVKEWVATNIWRKLLSYKISV